MSGPKRAHAGLRGLNGLALLAMVLVVGGIGAEVMRESIGWGLVLQIPLYAMIGLTWGTFTAAPWVRKPFLPGFGASALFTVVLYLMRHGDHVATQWRDWLDSFSAGSEAAATALFGQPAIGWLIVLFVAAPLAAFFKMRADGESDFTAYLLTKAKESSSEDATGEAS